jgi:hypothetical protein
VNALNLLFAVFIGLTFADIAAWLRGHHELSDLFEAASMVAFTGMAIVYMTRGQWLYAASYAAMLTLWIWRYWRRRKRRGKGRAALGAKARAKIAAMKRAMRERAQSPVLRPGLQGAR